MVGDVADHTERGNAWLRSWPDDEKKESAALAISVTEFVSVVMMARTLGEGSTPARISFAIMSKVIPDILCLRMARNCDGVGAPRLCGCKMRAAR